MDARDDVIAESLDLPDLVRAREVQQRILEVCEQRRFDPSSCFAIRLALEEAISNAFRHGNREDPSKRVRLEYRIAPDEVEFIVEDEGEGFDLSTSRTPRWTRTSSGPRAGGSS